MQVCDIMLAVENNDGPEIERGFRAIIGYPGEERLDATSAVSLLMALDATCDALKGNTRIMPRDTLTEISDAADEPVGGTYAAGAASVQEHRETWRRGLTARFRARPQVVDALQRGRAE